MSNFNTAFCAVESEVETDLLNARKTTTKNKQTNKKIHASHRPGQRRRRVALVEAKLADLDLELVADGPRPRVLHLPPRIVNAAADAIFLLLPLLLVLLTTATASSSSSSLASLDLYKGVRPPHRPRGRPQLREARIRKALPRSQDRRLADDSRTTDALDAPWVVVGAVAAVDDVPGPREELVGLPRRPLLFLGFVVFLLVVAVVVVVALLFVSVIFLILTAFFSFVRDLDPIRKGVPMEKSKMRFFRNKRKNKGEREETRSTSSMCVSSRKKGEKKV